MAGKKRKNSSFSHCKRLQGTKGGEGDITAKKIRVMSSTVGAVWDGKTGQKRSHTLCSSPCNANFYFGTFSHQKHNAY